MFFREPSIERIGRWLSRNPFSAPWAEGVGAGMVLGVTAAGAGLLAAGGLMRRRWPAPHCPPAIRGALWGLAVLAIFVFARDVHQDFIYFRF